MDSRTAPLPPRVPKTEIQQMHALRKVRHLDLLRELPGTIAPFLSIEIHIEPIFIGLDHILFPHIEIIEILRNGTAPSPVRIFRTEIEEMHPFRQRLRSDFERNRSHTAGRRVFRDLVLVIRIPPIFIRAYLLPEKKRSPATDP